MLLYILSIGSLFPVFCRAQTSTHYPAKVEKVLQKSGKNRPELEKALKFFYREKDSLKIKAINFLVANMDIHYSADYYWADEKGNKVPFSDLAYPSFDAAVEAFNQLKKLHPGLHPVSIVSQDIDSIKGEFLIENVQKAFVAWKGSLVKKLSFDYFCEYLLPYRVTIEPLEHWRDEYQQRFSPVVQTAPKTLQDYVWAIARDRKVWFTTTFTSEQRGEPLPRLGALQLLQRKKGACEDLASLEVFTLRSQGLPASVDFAPYWATSTGNHSMNATFDMNNQPIHFDAASDLVVPAKLVREPAKVVRVTYSKQPGVLAGFKGKTEIPEGFMRLQNYKDVTKEYWETKDITCNLFPAGKPHDIVYACVLNFMHWMPSWWGKVKANRVTFTNMTKGVVYLPAYYINGKMEPAGYPLAVGYNHEQELRPDTVHRRSIILQAQDQYLVYRPGMKYRLMYWNNGWKTIAAQFAGEKTTSMQFNNVPGNALFLLVPAGSQGKERPFMVTPDGQRLWF